MSMMAAKATEVATTLNVETPGPFIQFLMDLAQQLLPLLVNCIPKAHRNAAGLAASMQNPNLRQRAGLRFELGRNMDDPRTGMLTRQEIEAAFWKMGKGVSEPEAQEMMAEVAA